MNDLETAGHLRRAADYLRKHGWMQGDYGDDGGARCVTGAILSVTGLPSVASLSDPTWDRWREFWRALGLGETRSLASVNDQVGQTAEWIIDWLESSALGLEVRTFSAESGSGNPTVPVVAETRDYAKVAT